MAASLDSFQTHFLIPPQLFPGTTSHVNYWHSDPRLQSAPTDPKPGRKYIHTANLPHAYTSWASQVTQMIKNLPASARDLVLIPESGRSPGGGNGNPPLYSCLGNPMDRGAWCATVHGVAKSWTWLRDWHTHTHTHTHTHVNSCSEAGHMGKNKTEEYLHFSLLSSFLNLREEAREDLALDSY